MSSKKPKNYCRYRDDTLDVCLLSSIEEQQEVTIWMNNNIYKNKITFTAKYDDKCTQFLDTEINPIQVHVPNFGGLSGSEDRSGGDNSIQFINFGRVGDKSFNEWRQKIGGWKGG